MELIVTCILALNRRHAETHTVTVHITHTERVGIYFSLSGERNTWQKLFLQYLSLTQGMIVSYYSGQSPDFWAATSLFLFFFPTKSIFSFPALSPIRPFQRSWSWGGWGWREMDTERRKSRGREGERETERAREAVPLLPPVSQLGSVQLVLEKEAIICKPSSSVHTWTCFQHLSPRAVSVTNSNKHPKLITLLPLNSFYKEQKSHSQQSSCGIYFPSSFFFSFFRSFICV